MKGPATTRNGVRRNRRRLAADDRRRQIVAAATSFFAEVGFDGGTRALAERLGVTQPLIYRYFPSKDDLIKAVYEDVYVNRWQPGWDALIADRSIALADRLKQFYRRFTEVIFTPEWIRIYLFSGLRGLEINQWWISFVEERIMRTICGEIRHSHGLPAPDQLPIQPEEIELYWMLHGGIFYYGVRCEVYHATPHLDRGALIDVGVDSFLAGFAAVARRILVRETA